MTKGWKTCDFPKLITFFTLYFLVGILVILVASYYVIARLSPQLPPLESLENIYNEQPLSTEIYSSDGVLLRALAKEKRTWVQYDEIPPDMIYAVTTIEDQRFFKHWGFSLPDFFRAVKEDIITHSMSQGGSTITQQLAKNLYFGPEKKMVRKLKEVLTAIQIERTYTKPEIIEMYLNKVEFGNNAFGIQAGAQVYFGKDAKDLNLSESALLAGIIQNPAIHNPRSQIESRRQSALNRRNLVLRLMAQSGRISRDVAREETAHPILLAEEVGGGFGTAPYFVEYVRQELLDRFGEDTVMTDGLKVSTTLDSRLQKVAEDSLRAYLNYLQTNYATPRVHYVRPPYLTNEQAYKDSLAKTVVQGALVALDVRTGAILAMVGGAGNYGENFYNRATQAERQAGSSFKPFLYTAALDNGWRTTDTLIDSYAVFHDALGRLYIPKNFDEDYYGIITLRESMMHSVNVTACKLMNDTENRGVGPKTVIQYARKFGLTTLKDSDAVVSLAVGTAPVRLIEMTSAFSVFPNLGVKTEDFSIMRVQDKSRVVLYQQPNSEGAKSEVLNPAVASLMETMLRSVCTDGTAALTLRNRGMADRPCGGKTGTGNDFKDAWFIGYTPYIVCGVWVGFDSEETSLGGNAYGTGATAALPIWIGFMKAASDILKLPKTDFTYSGITTERICRDSHEKATPNCPESSIYTEYFIPGTEVTQECHIHGTSKGQTTTPFTTPRDIRGF